MNRDLRLISFSLLFWGFGEAGHHNKMMREDVTTTSSRIPLCHLEFPSKGGHPHPLKPGS